MRSSPAKYITASVIIVQTGTPELAMSADFIGKSISITRITTRMEMNRSLIKLNIDLFTAFGWSLMRLILTLGGSVSL